MKKAMLVLALLTTALVPTASGATDWIQVFKLGFEDFLNQSGEIRAETISKVATGTVDAPHVGLDLFAEATLSTHGLSCNNPPDVVDTGTGTATVSPSGGDSAKAVAHIGDCCKPSEHFQYYSSNHLAGFGVAGQPWSYSCRTSTCFWDDGSGPW